MHKPVIYTTLLFSFIGLLIFVSFYVFSSKDIVLEKNGLQFTKIEKTQIINPTGEPLVFIIKDKATNEKQVFKFNGYDSRHQINLLVTQPALSDKPDNDLFVEAINGQLLFTDTLKNLDVADIINTLSGNVNIEARQLVQYTAEPGLFGFLDDSPFIFLLFAIIVFFLIWVFDGIMLLFKRLLNVDPGPVLRVLAVLAAIWVFSGLREMSWMPATFLASLLKNAIGILPVFFVFHFLNRKWLKAMDFSDRELVKFLLLFFGTSLCFVFGNVAGFAVDKSQNPIALLGSNGYLPNGLAVGMIFAFTLGNFLNNVRRHLMHLGGNELLLQQSNQDVLRTQAELEALQASINPHFLYNALNAIAGLAKTDPEKTEKMALSLSAFFKYVNNKDDKHLSTLSDEIDILNNYIEIEKIRFGDRLEVDMQCAENALLCEMPRFILQPLVENAIKYGYNAEKITASVVAEIIDNSLIIKIYDSGMPFGDELSLGYGLKSISKKLQLLFPDNHKLAFVNTPQKHVLIRINQK